MLKMYLIGGCGCDNAGCDIGCCCWADDDGVEDDDGNGGVVVRRGFAGPDDFKTLKKGAFW